jgi:hypothetical protein
MSGRQAATPVIAWPVFATDEKHGSSASLVRINHGKRLDKPFDFRRRLNCTLGKHHHRERMVLAAVEVHDELDSRVSRFKNPRYEWPM